MKKKSDNGDNDKSKSGADDNNSNNENKASLQDNADADKNSVQLPQADGNSESGKMTTENSASSETIESKSTVQAHGSTSS